MESVRKNVECTLGILKKKFIFSKNPIAHHFPEMIVAAFTTCYGLHNWLHSQDGWNDWEEKGNVSEEDVVVGYNVLDQNNRCYRARSVYHDFRGSFTR